MDRGRPAVPPGGTADATQQTDTAHVRPERAHDRRTCRRWGEGASGTLAPFDGGVPHELQALEAQGGGGG